MHQGRVLLIDGDAGRSTDLGQGLDGGGFFVETAATPAEGLAKARASDPELILLALDLGLPFLVELKNDDLVGTIPVLAYGPGPVSEDIEIAALDGGASAVLELPCAPARLSARVGSHLNLYRSQVELREKVIHDQLTGVFSRRYLFESMRQHVNQFSRPGPPVLCCLMIDVDHFKMVNDKLGHFEGDRILRNVAKLIFGMTRKGDVVARFGGEEFVVVLPSTDPEGARLVADKLRRAVESNCGVTISLGVSWYISPAQPEERNPYTDEEMMQLLLSRADVALYDAKRQGRNRVCLQTDYSGPERRRLSRVEVPFQVTLRGPAEALFEGAADVSAGGLTLSDSQALVVGDPVNVTLAMESGPVVAQGRVVWTCSPPGGGERCGVAFESFQGEGHDRLIRELGHRSRVKAR